MHPSVPSRCTARHANLAKRQFVCSPPNRGSAKLCEPHFSAAIPGSCANHRRGGPPSFVSAAYSTTTTRHTPPFCNLPPQGRSDPVMELDQSHPARRRVIGRVIGRGSKCKCKTFLRLLDRRMKAKSDAPFVLSLFCILSLHTENQHASPQIEDGPARETRSRLAFPPALPPQPPDVGALRDGVVLG
jgi:hypothetical protein